MRHALEAGTIVSIVAGVVGYFVVVRRSSFAAHALSHAGFAGAAGAVLLRLNPIVGLLAFTMGGGILMGALGKKAEGRDVQVGTVLSFMLGLGVLFISLYKGYATEAYSLLFGEILGISQSSVVITLVAGIVILIAIACIYRPLLFSSLDEDVAEAKGLSVFTIGIVFMLIIAVATSIAVQIVGVLLIFALMVTPAAIAERLASTPAQGHRHIDRHRTFRDVDRAYPGVLFSLSGEFFHHEHHLCDVRGDAIAGTSPGSAAEAQPLNNASRWGGDFIREWNPGWTKLDTFEVTGDCSCLHKLGCRLESTDLPKEPKQHGDHRHAQQDDL